MFDSSLRDEVTRNVDVMLDPTGRLLRRWQQGQPPQADAQAAAEPPPFSVPPAVGAGEAPGDAEGAGTRWQDVLAVLSHAGMAGMTGVGLDPDVLPGARKLTMQQRLDNIAIATALAPGLGDAAGLLADAYMYWNEPDSRTPANATLTATGALPWVGGAGIIRHVRDTPWGPGISGKTWREVVEALRQQKTGAIVGHLDHPLVSPDIALPWGMAGPRSSNTGYGLAKLDAWHPDIVDHLPELLRSTALSPPRPLHPSRAQLAGPRLEAAVESNWHGDPIDWLVTAYRPTRK